MGMGAHDIEESIIRADCGVRDSYESVVEIKKSTNIYIAINRDTSLRDTRWDHHHTIL